MDVVFKAFTVHCVVKKVNVWGRETVSSGFDFEPTMKVIDRRRAGILHVLNCALMAD